MRTFSLSRQIRPFWDQRVYTVQCKSERTLGWTPWGEILFFQNAHSSEVATDVDSKIPHNQTDIGPHKKSHQDWQGVGAGDLPEGHGSMLLSPYENFIMKCDASGHKSTSVLFQKFNFSILFLKMLCHFKLGKRVYMLFLSEGSYLIIKFSCGDNSTDPCPSGGSPAPTSCQPWSTFLSGLKGL